MSVSLAEPYKTDSFFARTPVEFVVLFLRYQNLEKVFAFPVAVSICFWYLRTVDVYVISDYIFRAVHSVHFRQYCWDKAFHFPGKFHFLVKAVTDSADSVRLWVVYSNLVLSTIQWTGLCSVKFTSSLRPTMTSPRSTIYSKNDYNVNLLYCNCQ